MNITSNVVMVKAVAGDAWRGRKRRPPSPIVLDLVHSVSFKTCRIDARFGGTLLNDRRGWRVLTTWRHASWTWNIFHDVVKHIILAILKKRYFNLALKCKMLKQNLTIFMIVKAPHRHRIRVHRIRRSGRFRADKWSWAEWRTADHIRSMPPTPTPSWQVSFKMTVALADRSEGK